jgi:hypothetical protein
VVKSEKAIRDTSEFHSLRKYLLGCSSLCLMSVKANSNSAQSEDDGNIKVLVERPICSGEESASSTLPNGLAGKPKRYVVRLLQFADSNTLSVGISRQWWKPATTTVNNCGTGHGGEWLPARRGGHLFMPVHVWQSLVSNIDDVSREIEHHVLQNNDSHHEHATVNEQQQRNENDGGRGRILGGDVSATAAAASNSCDAYGMFGPTRANTRNDAFGAARAFDGPTTVNKRNATTAFYGKASPPMSLSSRDAPSVYNTASGSGAAATDVGSDITSSTSSGEPASKFGRYNAAFAGGRRNGGGGHHN